jgi:hypothetical protein
MYVQTRSTREELQQVIVRKEQEVRRWIAKNLGSTEEYNLARTHDGIGLRVGIRSIQAKELLQRLYREVFSPLFEEPKPSLDETGVWTAWFGYSEPASSPHYVSME